MSVSHPEQQQWINGAPFLRFIEAAPCFLCDGPTKLLSVDFEAPVHAGCAEKAWKEVLSAALIHPEEN